MLGVLACSPKESVSTDELIETQEASEPPKDTDNLDPSTLENRSKAAVLAYFDSLIREKKVLAGQHCGNGPDDISEFYDIYIDRLADQTGKHIGLMGADMGFYPSIDYPVQQLITHWNEGGLITLSWHADNPFVDGYDPYWNTVENKDQINLNALLKGAPQTQARINYRTELDKVALALQELRDAGLVIIWRPFHEMNGDFFWWGADAYNNQQTNEADYKALWIDLYDTLTNDYDLDNLIWTYSVIPDKGWNADVTSFYPGSDFVDLVGMDYYGVSPDFPDYDALKSLGKTIVMSESGPIDEGYGKWNMMELVNALKGKAAYFLQWHSWNNAAVAIKDNINYDEMMKSQEVITLDEL